MAKPEGLLALPIPKGAPDPPAPQDPLAPEAPHMPQALHQPIPYMPPVNWSNFKPKFSGKPDEDAEAHLLRTDDWMDTHRFQDNNNVKRFCLTLTGEARPWYESFKTNKCRLDRIRELI